MDEVSQQVIPPTSNVIGNTETYYKPAGFLTRLSAAIIDGIILLIIAIPLTFLLGLLIGQSFNLGKDSSFQLLIALIGVTYNVALLTMQGATLGKKVVHIRVVNTNYQPIKLSQALVRETIGKILSSMIFSLGYLWIAIDKKKQGWHDKIAKTYVIHEQPVTQQKV